MISLFSGCGGSSLGYRWAGFRELLAVDFDEHAVETFELNFPDVPCWERDIRKVEAEEILGFCGIGKGDFDLLDGSPPCQGFSTAGKKDVADVRNDLAFEFARFIDDLRPRAFVMENVSGLVKGWMKGLFKGITRRLKETGYRVECRMLNAMWYGVPQSRERLIWIGMRDGREIKWPERQGIITVKDAIGDLGDEQDLEKEHVWLDESPQGLKTKTWPLANKTRQGKKYAGQYARNVWGRPASTVCTPGICRKPYLRNMSCHPLYTRTYSILEVKRLCTFPDGFRFPGMKWDAMTRMGNAVPPRMMEAIAGAVKGVLNGHG